MARMISSATCGTFFEDLLCIGFFLAESNCAVSAVSGGDGESSNPGKEVEMGWLAMAHFEKVSTAEFGSTTWGRRGCGLEVSAVEIELPAAARVPSDLGPFMLSRASLCRCSASATPPASTGAAGKLFFIMRNQPRAMREVWRARASMWGVWLTDSPSECRARSRTKPRT